MTEKYTGKKVFAEIGYGNDTFLSTEIEIWEDGDEIEEKRVTGFVLAENIKEIYLRVWIGEKIYAVSSKYGFNIRKKDKKKIKFLFGVGGEGLKK